MKLPRFPAPLSRLAARLPALPASLVFAAVGNLLVWPRLRDLDWSTVHGRRICVRVSDLGLRFHFSLRERGFHAEANENSDVTFSATAEDLARLALRLEDPDTLFFNRRLRIEGDTDLGLTVKNQLDSLERPLLGLLSARAS